MEANAIPSSEIRANFDALRTAIEDRRYEEIDALLQQQRTLVKDLPLTDPDVHEALCQAQQLTLWALTMVKMQRAALEQRLAAVAQLKNVEKYRGHAAPLDGPLVHTSAE